MFPWSSLRGSLGRGEELQTLNQAVQQAVSCNTGGNNSCVLLYGASGCGRTDLIHRTKKDFTDNVADSLKYFWVTGSYANSEDNTQLMRPYSGIADATTQLCQEIIGSDDALCIAIQKSVCKEIGNEDLRMLLAICPAIQWLLPQSVREAVKKRKELSEKDMAIMLASPNAFHRLIVLYRRLFHAITSSCRPVAVIFYLRELQWADKMSRNLLKRLANDRVLKNMCIIGTVQTENDGKTPIDGKTFDLPKQTTGMAVHRLHLGPLDEQVINEVLSQVLDCPAESTKKLAGLIYQRTQGITQHVKEYVEMLKRENLLRLVEEEERKNAFEWNMDEILAHKDTQDGIIGLFRHKIGYLSREVQILVILSSHLPSSFQDSILEELLTPHMVGLFPNDLTDQNDWINSSRNAITLNVKGALKKACQEGLFSRKSKRVYSFCHEQIRLASASFLDFGPLGDIIRSHLGKTLFRLSGISLQEKREGGRNCTGSSSLLFSGSFSGQSKGNRDWMLYTASNLLNKYGSTSKKTQVAEINLRASCKAASQGAFGMAASYARKGIEILGDEAWSGSQYNLMLQLSVCAAEASLSAGQLEACDAHCRSVQRHAATPRDRYTVERVEMQRHMQQ